MTTLDADVRELTFGEIEEVAGGPLPVVAVYAAGLLVGAALVGGGYLLAKLT